MSKLWRWLAPLLFVALLAAAPGCSGRGGAKKAPDTRTPVQYFKQEQVDTMTPHGKIVADSVEEQGGKIQYKTEDGHEWRVRYTKRADGTYQYGMPDAVKNGK